VLNSLPLKLPQDKRTCQRNREKGKHPYFRDSFFGSQAIWLGSHPEARGHGSSKRRASRGISGFSSLGKIHGLTNQFACLFLHHGNKDASEKTGEKQLLSSMFLFLLFCLSTCQHSSNTLKEKNE